MPFKGHNLRADHCQISTVRPRMMLTVAKPVNLTTVYHINLCWRYCSTSHGQWSSHFFTETANQPSWKPKLVSKMENKSYWIQVDPRHINHTKRNVTPSSYKRTTTPKRICQVYSTVPRQETYWCKHIFTKRKQLSIKLIKCTGYLDASQNSL
jgi:hypothetical protein